jgi:cysteinyl-tRNA synthetase
MLHIFNSLSRSKEQFVPIEPNKVRMYVCGMTVYDYCHIGHARVLVVFDIVYRYLKSIGYDVTYVRNITDIDDKIIQRALENNETIEALTSRFILAMREDALKLNTLAPDQEPKATEHIEQILAMIERLIERGHAYVAANNDVYFSVSGFEGYGKLSGRMLDELLAGARVEVDSNKRDPLDFVLWKSAKPDEPSWSSPWGEGRPGWHIECSAMSTHCLGNHFDIHGGGMDLQFPHHENEIAQSEGSSCGEYVNVWMHNGFIRIDDEKMSKSLGNFFTIREVLKEYKGEEIRFFMLGSHYRSPLNYSLTQLDNARAGLSRLYTALRGIDRIAEQAPLMCEHMRRFEKVMNDDFNTPETLAIMFELSNLINRESDQGKKANLGASLKAIGARLGLLEENADAFLKSASSVSSVIADEEIEALIAQRSQARSNKDFAESDRLRDVLSEQGISLEDKDGKTQWRRSL